MSNVFRLVAVVFVALVAFASGFSMRDVLAGRAPSTSALQNLMTGQARPKETPVEVFQSHFSKIKTNYQREIPNDNLRYYAMGGMFASLGDPHTSFLPPVDAENLKLETKGDFVGIGARLSPDPLGAKIATVFRNAPAEKAGLKIGDTIIQVDNKETAGMETDEIVSLIRGKEGTKVEIRLTRIGQAEPITVQIVRAVVEIPTAEGRILKGTDIGYIAISQFAETTTDQFDQALDEIIGAKPKGLVIDLRGNPGGLLDSAAKLLARFVPGKPVVKMRGRGGNEQFVGAPFFEPKKLTFPIAVLVNEESASAAEIFSGVMQEYKKATVVGQHSYGKASVQNVFALIDGSSAKITIARYYLPSGTDISRVLDEGGEYVRGGIKPDVQAKLVLDSQTLIGDPEHDSQLQKAVEVVRSKGG
ncbi:MAG: S41 family peptidase [Fimbriimonadaceae bacterium]|nr:S41 family peptidase [Fimbriimonadaceae bacterium]QYK55742.1 MAG: S41 family peptidase [Fimbriimonadaceae bacterium]